MESGEGSTAGTSACSRARHTLAGSEWKAVTALLGLVSLLALPSLGCSFNDRLAEKQQAIEDQWTLVERLLQERDDAVAMLLRETGALVPHHHRLFESLAESRARLALGDTRGAKIEAANAQTMALNLLVSALLEPGYEAARGDTLAALMAELSSIEGRLSMERSRYNEGVRQFEIWQRRFPASTVGRLIDFPDYPLFESSAVGEETPSRMR
jgi:LemA protein